MTDREEVVEASRLFMTRNGSSQSEITVFTALVNKLLTENAHIDWNAWSHLPPNMERHLESLTAPSDEMLSTVLSRVAVIRLNGGLGTTMGCKGPKSVIQVKEGLSFLEIALRQHEEFNRRHSSSVPLLLMNSFNTDFTTRSLVGDRALCFTQSKCPRLDAETLKPIGNEEESWYPPGHGNIVVALHDCGLLDELLGKGRDIVFVSNIDNTGADLDVKIASLMANEGIEYLMECTPKTAVDLKGGTLIQIKGRAMHLEMPQVPPDHIDDFCSTRVFSIFNTNNIWLNLSAVKDRPYEITSEIIVNKKACRTYKTSGGRKIIQLETSIGGAIKNFDKALCVHVPRSRFIPVKGTADLLSVSSDLYYLDSSYCLRLSRPPPPPIIALDSHFQTVGLLHSRFPVTPSLSQMTSLSLKGDISFEGEVTFIGDVSLSCSSPTVVPKGKVFKNESVHYD